MGEHAVIAPVATPMPESELDARVVAAERILRIFLPERIGYLAVSVLSCTTLFVVIWQLIHDGKATNAQLTLMFGATGLTGISALRVLRMFHDVMNFVQKHRVGGGDA